jgi:hypothetical protein
MFFAGESKHQQPACPWILSQATPTFEDVFSSSWRANIYSIPQFDQNKMTQKAKI